MGVSPLIERLAAKSKMLPSLGCLEWMGWRNERGYGKILIDGRAHYVHRVAFEEYHGRKLLPGEVVRHVCDNPRCWNPQHLISGSIAENVADAVSRGRHGTSRKRCRRLSALEVVNIKLRLSYGHSPYAIAFDMGCGVQTIRDIRDRKTWANRKPSSPDKSGV